MHAPRDLIKWGHRDNGRLESFFFPSSALPLYRSPANLQRLVLGRGRDVAIGGEPTQERRHFGCAHFSGVALVVMENEVADPESVGFFGARTIVTRTDRRAKAIDQAGRIGCV